MIFGLNKNGKKIDIENSLKEEQYYCPCCGTELIQKKGLINSWHFAHKSLSECDNWYEENEWSRMWIKMFNSEYREVVIKNESDNRKRIADIKYKSLVLKLQSKSVSGEEFIERIEYFSKENNLVYLVDCRDKDIEYLKTKRTHNFVWKHAYKFGNIDKFNSNFYLFFQINDNTLIRVVWNKEGFKYFGGYTYNINEFKEVLTMIADNNTPSTIVKWDNERYKKECFLLLEKILKVDMRKYNYKLINLFCKCTETPYLREVILYKSNKIEYIINSKKFKDEKHKVNYVFKILEKTIEEKPIL